MDHPKDVGDRSTLAIMLALVAAGYGIATPFGENSRYDLILDNGESLLRIQCKTGRLRKGAIEFPTASSYYHHPNEKPTQRHYHGQVDVFAVYCRQTSGVYLIPVDELPLDRAYLRVTPPLNSQRKRIRNATDYEVAHVEWRSVELRRDHGESGASLPAVSGSPARVGLH